LLWNNLSQVYKRILAEVLAATVFSSPYKLTALDENEMRTRQPRDNLREAIF
jgi:hypothetical protein